MSLSIVPGGAINNINKKESRTRNICGKKVEEYEATEIPFCIAAMNITISVRDLYINSFLSLLSFIAFSGTILEIFIE